MTSLTAPVVATAGRTWQPFTDEVVPFLPYGMYVE
jgi:hypothetical protein